MKDEGSSEPDWTFSLDDAPPAPSEDAVAALAAARVAGAAFLSSVRDAQAHAREAETRLLEAHAAGASSSMLAEQMGLSLDAVEQILRRETHLLPDLG